MKKKKARPHGPRTFAKQGLIVFSARWVAHRIAGRTNHEGQIVQLRTVKDADHVAAAAATPRIIHSAPADPERAGPGILRPIRQSPGASVNGSRPTTISLGFFINLPYRGNEPELTREAIFFSDADTHGE